MLLSRDLTIVDSHASSERKEQHTLLLGRAVSAMSGAREGLTNLLGPGFDAAEGLFVQTGQR